MTAALASKSAEKKTRTAEPVPSSCDGAHSPGCGAPAGLPIFLKSLTGAASMDPLEREADRVAEHLASGTDCACKHSGTPCPKCREESRRTGAAGNIARKEKSSRPPQHFHPDTVRSAVAPLTGGNPLPRSERSFFEPRFDTSFEDVRIHTGRAAESAAARLNARAFTLGSNVVFGHGEYQPQSPDGRRLLAHELTHVVQQSSSSAAPEDLQRDVLNQSISPAYAAGLGDSTLQAEVNAVRNALSKPGTGAVGSDTLALQQNLDVLEAEVRKRNLPPPAADTRDLATRLASFKQLVLTTARLRLASNRSNLAIWRGVVQGLPLSQKTAQAIQVAQIQETVGHNAVGQWDVNRCLAERNPINIQLYCGQLEGRYRACTGCHLAQQATALAHDVGPMGQASWSSKAAQLTGIPDPQRPNFSFSSGSMSGAGPDWNALANPAPTAAQMKSIDEITRTYRIIIQALGPDGYQVWPDSFVNWDSAVLEAVRSGILSRIDQRQSDYLELMFQIQMGKRDYLEFEPVLASLRSTADAEVQHAVQEEIDARKTAGIVESILIGIATVVLLLLTIFPPTTAIGVAGLAALEVGLGTVAVIKGAEMFDQGYAYDLATGADDVYTPEQQKAGAAMMFMGFINMVTGPLMAYTGAMRGVGAVSRIEEAGTLSSLSPAKALSQGKASVFGAGDLTSLGAGTVRQGRLIVSFEADGTVVGTVEGQDSMLMIVKDGEAVLYERGADGTLTAINRAPAPNRLLGPGDAQPLDPAVAANIEAWQQLTANNPAAARLFAVGEDLSGIDELALIDHGAAADVEAMSAGKVGADTVNLSGVGHVTPEQLAEILQQQGWKGGYLRLISCSTGMCSATGTAFGEELVAALAARELPTVVAAPKGLVQVGSDLFQTPAPAVMTPGSQAGAGVNAFNYFVP
jgi:Domain of unknown function (DUF4157)